MIKFEKQIVIIILLLAIALSSVLLGVKADSGFDASYDSGGSSSWSSSDSSWSSSDSRSSSRSDNLFLTFIAAIIFMLIFYFIEVILIPAIIRIINQIKQNIKDKINGIRNKYYYKKVCKIFPDFDANQFLLDRYSDYITIQNAWMNFDYNTLKEKLTDELYNQYIMQLDTLKIKKEQNIMRDFNLNDKKIIGLKIQNDIVKAKIGMTVSFYDYIKCNNKVVRGQEYKKITIHYEMTFIRSLKDNIDKCPKCHAPLTDASSQVCQYCRVKISRTGYSWVMSKKENKKQW